MLKPGYCLSGIVALVTACATPPAPPPASASSVPKERIIDAQFMEVRAVAGEVVIARDASTGGNRNAGGCMARVFVNSMAIADLQASEKVDLHLPPGEYVFAARSSGGCHGESSDVHGTVRDGEASAYRVTYSSHGDLSIGAASH